MLKNLTPKTMVILGVFTAYALFTYFNYENIANYIATSNTLIALLVYIVFNPAYVLIIYGLWTRFAHRRAWKRLIAIIVGIFSLDFLAIPRLAITDQLTNGPAITTNIGSIVMRTLEHSFSHNFAYMLMYLILPIVGLAIAVELLGITNFIKEVR